MVENILAPKIRIHQNHRPQMQAGEYTIKVTGSIEGETATTTQRFYVGGERFHLNPKDIRAVFPAVGSSGNYESVLPHIILNRNTLPWERTAYGGDNPWLILLLFDESEAPEKKIITVKEFFDQLPTDTSIEQEPSQHDEEQLTVIDIEKNLLSQLLPKVEELSYLAHTRQGIDENNNIVGEENAIIFCNRLPAAGKKSTVHLVSVENRYNKDGFKFLPNVSDEALIRLVSLKSWSFYTAAEVGHFDALLKRLDSGMFQLPVLKKIDTDSTTLPYLSQGLVPLEHHFRTGDTSVSWYRSPFVPLGVTMEGQALPNNTKTADDLLKFDSDKGMFDATYAAAWEIGRLLALASKEFSVQLYHYQQLLLHQKHKAKAVANTRHLALTASNQNHESPDNIWTQHLKPWLIQLANLQYIPANYLVPKEGLLPKESIRFFEIDKNWQRAALRGALSLVRKNETETDPIETLISETGYLSGFLLRSSVVQHWAGLIIEGYETIQENEGNVLIDASKDASFNSLSENSVPYLPLRRKLGQDILLCLFKTNIKQVNIHQRPEVLHFGVNQKYIEVKNNRVVDLRTTDTSKCSIAEFAMNMIEKAPIVQFMIKVK